jgi:hypothetical protein
MVIAGGLGTGNLAIFSLWRCLRDGVVIKFLNYNRLVNSFVNDSKENETKRFGLGKPVVI